jgi:hypothetical protein
MISLTAEHLGKRNRGLIAANYFAFNPATYRTTPTSATAKPFQRVSTQFGSSGNW